ncbi:AGE family epimerase/isomerase [Paenibacillus koleovorans]|uniref:AGE family epimerase/isomerase n=1 Tax=Paenibacillus koleovorans TaxID=121608 RepID=UPI000FD9E3B2|nr:AGE family epimerase/isomerase [Paenibacillus koleovorans]
MNTQRMSWSELLGFYEKHLFEQVMPFWLKHAIDDRHGGINNIIRDDGAVISTDKIIWSQGRALWTFSAIHNYLDQDPKWLETAHGIARLLFKHGRNNDGAWVFRIHEDGRIADPTTSIYVDAFVTYGMTEYARATGSAEALQIALDNYARVLPLLYDHKTLPTAPLPIPEGLQAHGPFMIYALVFYELGLLTQRDDIMQEALRAAETIMTEHVHPEERVLFEYVQPGGTLASTDAGRTYIPGHAIESMWFLERIYTLYSQPERVRQTLDVIRWNLEKGWDSEYGGIFLARHLDGGPPAWFKPDSKVWWPATETLYALLRAYELSGESWCLDWYWQVHDYSFARYPNLEHGEWRQNLDRYGEPMEPVVSTLPVKDPFHLPRALLLAIQTLRRLAAAQSPA